MQADIYSLGFDGREGMYVPLTVIVREGNTVRKAFSRFGVSYPRYYFEYVFCILRIPPILRAGETLRGPLDFNKI